MQNNQPFHRASYGLLGSDASSGEGWKSDSDGTVKNLINKFTDGRGVAAEFDLPLQFAKSGYVRIWNKDKTSIVAVSIISQGGEARNQKRHVFFDVSDRMVSLEGLWDEIKGVLSDEGVTILSPSINVCKTGPEFEEAVLFSSINICDHIEQVKFKIHVGNGPERFAGAVLCVRAVTSIEISIPLYDEKDQYPDPPIGLKPFKPEARFVLQPTVLDDKHLNLDDKIDCGEVTSRQVLEKVKFAALAVVCGPLNFKSVEKKWKRYIEVPLVLKPLRFLLVGEVSKWLDENLEAKSDSTRTYVDGCLDCFKREKDDLVSNVLDNLEEQKQKDIRIEIEKKIVGESFKLKKL